MKIFAALLFGSAWLLGQPAGVIETVAGFDADGVTATSVGLTATSGVAADAAGNVYFSQALRHRVYRVTPAGVLEIVAGSGVPGDSGDGGPAREARLDQPTSVAVDRAGNLYIATPAGIRGVSMETGVIRTVVKLEANGPLRSIAWIACAPGGRLIVADRVARMLKSVDAESGAVTHVAGTGKSAIAGDNGPAISASLQAPSIVASDEQGNIYYAELLEPRVRRIDANTGNIATVPFGLAGEDVPGEYEVASGLAAVAEGNLYIAQVERGRVLKVSASGEVSVLAGVEKGLALPKGLAAGASGEVLVAEFVPGRILRVGAGGDVAAVAGNGLNSYNGDGAGPLRTQLAEPANVLPGANGELYIASTFAHRVLRADAGGMVSTAVGGGSPTGAEIGEETAPLTVVLNRPQALLQDVNGDLLFSDYDNGLLGRVLGGGTGAKLERRIPIASTAFPSALLQQGTLAGDGTRVFLSSPSDHHVWVLEAGRVRPFAGTGEAGFRGEGGAARDAWLRNPSGLALDKEGNLYIADTRNHRIRKVDAATGSITTVWPAGEVDEASLPTGLALDAKGVLYAADAGLHRVWRIELDSGKATVVAGNGEAGFSGDGGPASDAKLYRPCGIAFDSEGRLYVADTGNQRIRRIRFGAE